MFQHLYLEGNDFIAVLAGENGPHDQHTQPNAQAGPLDGLCLSLIHIYDAGHRGLCTAVELDADASALCRRAVQETPGAEHITALCTDLRTFCKSGPEQGKYDFAACNPPSFDYKQLQFFRVDTNRAESKGIILNIPLMERYRVWFILFYSLIVGALVLLVAWLFRANRRERCV